MIFCFFASDVFDLFRIVIDDCNKFMFSSQIPNQILALVFLCEARQIPWMDWTLTPISVVCRFSVSLNESCFFGGCAAASVGDLLM